MLFFLSRKETRGRENKKSFKSFANWFYPIHKVMKQHHSLTDIVVVVFEPTILQMPQVHSRMFSFILF